MSLRRALIDLGIGLWHSDPAAQRYGKQLRARGKHGGMIACAMAHRANKIAFALVRDQAGYDPTRWPDHISAFLDRGHLRRRAGAVNWSARSAARTNEVDRASTGARSGSEEAERKVIANLHNPGRR